MKPYQTIEEASRGATYQNRAGTFTVYEHSIYPRGSVLAGQARRVWLDEFDSLEAARKAYPKADFSGCTYQPPCLSHLPDPEGPDPFGDNAEVAAEMANEGRPA